METLLLQASTDHHGNQNEGQNHMRIPNDKTSGKESFQSKTDKVNKTIGFCTFE